MVQEQFAENITAQETSKMLKQAFPGASSERSTFIFGVRRHHPGASSSSLPLVRPLPFVPTQAQVHSLQTQNAALLQQVSQLKAQNEQLRSAIAGDIISVSVLDKQLLRFVSLSAVVSHGPDSLERLEAFSLDAVVTEVKSLAANLFRLFSTLGQTRRNTGNEEQGLVTEEIKALCFLCTLLNARTMRTKGLQLMLGMM